MTTARVISICALTVLAAGVLAQDGGLFLPSKSEGKVTRRLKIRRADPALIMLMLKGSQSTQIPPEISTVQNSGNGGFGNSGFAGSGNSGRFGQFGPGGSSGQSGSGRQGPSTGSGSGNDRGGRFGG